MRPVAPLVTMASRSTSCCFKPPAHPLKELVSGQKTSKFTCGRKRKKKDKWLAVKRAHQTHNKRKQWLSFKKKKKKQKGRRRKGEWLFRPLNNFSFQTEAPQRSPHVVAWNIKLTRKIVCKARVKDGHNVYMRQTQIHTEQTQTDTDRQDREKRQKDELGCI